jgi:tetratricopeptide (TPR) repeat protein
MGQLSTSDLVLLVIGEMPERRIQENDLEDISIALGRSIITLKRSITYLKKKDLLMKSREHNTSVFTITEDGISKVDEIRSRLDNLYLVPERHNIPVAIKLVNVLNLINNPFFRVFLLNLFFERREFDLLYTLKTFELLENETSIYNLFENVKIFQNPTGISNFVHSFMDSTLFGIEREEEIQETNRVKRGYEVLLLEAQIKVSQGEFTEGLDRYNEILKMPDIPPDVWFITCVGKIKTLANMGKRKEMNQVLEETRYLINNKMAIAYLNQIQADILGIEGDFKNAKCLFNKCIGTFRHYNHPLFLSIAYNNYGILMFNREKYSEAEKLWKQAKRYALEGESSYQDAIVQTNLSSIERLKGDLKKAKKHLVNARKIYKDLNNLENISDLEFNISLIHLSEENMDQAIELFNRSMFETFPFLSDIRREERLNVFTREAKKYKYTPSWNGSKYDLIYIG